MKRFLKNNILIIVIIVIVSIIFLNGGYKSLQEYKEYVTLKQAEKKINSSKFIRCNRGFLVNLSYVDSVKKDTCLIGKDALIVSRPQKNSFMKAFIEYLNGEQ